MSTCKTSTHVLAVEDADRSADYYAEVLGFEKDPFEIGPGWRVVRNGACTISLGSCDGSGWVPASELVYHSFFAYLTFDDPHAYFEQVTAAGVEIKGEPRRTDGRVVEFSIKTIDGHGIMCGGGA